MNDSSFTLKKGESAFSFLGNGSPAELLSGGIRLNAYAGLAADPSPMGIWLRLYQQGESALPMVSQLLGGFPTTAPQLSLEREDGFCLQGQAAPGLDYTLRFFLAEETLWFWDLKLRREPDTDRTVEENGPISWSFDVIYGQDLGLADRATVLTNELYVSQYLDRRACQTEQGWTLMARQNLQQSQDRFPFLQEGLLNARVAGFKTDAADFFGPDFKAGRQIAGLSAPQLGSRINQGEMAYTALQSERLTLLPGQERELTFYGLYQPRQTQARQKPYPLTACLQSAQSWLDTLSLTRSAAGAKELSQTPASRPLANDGFARSRLIGDPYQSPDAEADEVAGFYPRQILSEYNDGKLLSFFTPGDYRHVVTRYKEQLLRRPHGLIMLNLPDVDQGLTEDCLASTNYMYGLFNAQTVIGNSSFHKVISASRSLINLQYSSGQRLWIQGQDGCFHLLTLPALYEMSPSVCRWRYKLEDHSWLEITSTVAADRPVMTLKVQLETGSPARAFWLTQRLVMGEHEDPANPPRLAWQTDGCVRLRPSQKQAASSPYPDWYADLKLAGGQAQWGRDGVFFADGKDRDATLLTARIAPTTGFTLTLTGSLSGPAVTDLNTATASEPASVMSSCLSLQALDPAVENRLANARLRRLINHFELQPAPTAGRVVNADQAVPLPGESCPTEQINAQMFWYAHNAMVHLASPHGLEQPGGAAWGTRDICQGPFEFLLAGGHYAFLRQILCRVFAHQSQTSGQWPQWFMFDRYRMDAGSCHGDVVFWPLKCAAEYLLASGDQAILQTSLPYLEPDSQPESLLQHLKRAADQYERRFLPGTALLSYAGGDWDDTLQPATQALKEGLVSSWTQALAYQSATELARALQPGAPHLAGRLAELAASIRADFNRYLIVDGVIAGFVRRQPDGSFFPLLHPADQRTGIHYRLLPMDQSITSELVSQTQARRNLKLIRQQLWCPDGVRLMSAPAQYTDGIPRLFQRAEQAANVGREISLQYTHAHIRYLETLAKMGEGEACWDNLERILPIGLSQKVPNAACRQSNLYFSSSDPDVPDRMSFARQFKLLRQGQLRVEGGWRLYSSGPGILYAELLTLLLGLRLTHDQLILDPVLPQRADGWSLNWAGGGHYLHLTYHIAGPDSHLIRLRINGSEGIGAQPLADNPYRGGGLFLPLDQLPASQPDQPVRLELYCQPDNCR
ncbi:hypothetical protein HCH52_08570 [Oscillospiraceae bacterium HV4-5-C5C]|nr:hypothetical protein [Oscillospiraceae bacterium HV4-5-C5C]